MTSEAVEHDRASNRGLRVQLQTMEALSAAREKQFALCREQRDGLLWACQAAEEWLSGWASAEPYIVILRAAIAKATGAA